jgi:Na+-transporting methylmalonyl-CoA/oxaloacetate decarboxylase gamma subunit
MTDHKDDEAWAHRLVFRAAMTFTWCFVAFVSPIFVCWVYGGPEVLHDLPWSKWIAAPLLGIAFGSLAVRSAWDKIAITMVSAYVGVLALAKWVSDADHTSWFELLIIGVGAPFLTLLLYLRLRCFVRACRATSQQVVEAAPEKHCAEPVESFQEPMWPIVKAATATNWKTTIAGLALALWANVATTPSKYTCTFFKLPCLNAMVFGPPLVSCQC